MTTIDMMSCLCRDPLREVSARCPQHGHSPDEEPRSGHESKSRAEHLAWCKERAILELDADPRAAGPGNALASMVSDTGKHPETAGHAGNELFTLELFAGTMRTPDDVRRFIEGYR